MKIKITSPSSRNGFSWYNGLIGRQFDAKFKGNTTLISGTYVCYYVDIFFENNARYGGYVPVENCVEV